MQKNPGSFPFQKSVDRGRQIVDIVTSLVATVERGGAGAAPLVAAGKIHEVGREFATALAAYEAAGDAAEAVVRIAIVQLKIGEPVKALAIIKAFVGKNPDFRFKDISGRPLSGLTVLGDAYRANGDLTAAQQAYAQALKLEPRDGQSAGQLARMHISNNEAAAAIELSSRFLDRDEMAALESTTRLLANDPNRLPALGGLVNSFAAKISDVR
ncbi:tetratricopeptide repeat protein [Sphingomonas sp. ERG5]|uniref:tetratricopeptide repeat protein n=1 Tax=Sphingomonas sp. ERG5 TaxID=1381597 RepID=UPI00054B1902|nr:tetratricopeptide repeat protein [Sphingomonas sp. ERG5]